MFRMIDKLLCLFVCLPPVYMLYRFMRWYVRQEQSPEKELDQG